MKPGPAFHGVMHVGAISTLSVIVAGGADREVSDRERRPDGASRPTGGDRIGSR